MQTEAVQGAQAKWNELYEQYYERHFVTSNEEMYCLRSSYLLVSQSLHRTLFGSFSEGSLPRMKAVAL